MHRAEFEVYLRHASKPTETEFDYRFELPRDIWSVDDVEDRYKIFISEQDVIHVGVFFIGINDKRTLCYNNTVLIFVVITANL